MPSESLLLDAINKLAHNAAEVEGNRLDWERCSRAKQCLYEANKIKKELALENRALVYSRVNALTKKFPAMHDYEEDLINDGMLGLLRAIDKYHKGRSKFSTYATPWINEAIFRSCDRFLERDRQSKEYPRVISLFGPPTGASDLEHSEDDSLVNVIPDMKEEVPESATFYDTLADKVVPGLMLLTEPEKLAICLLNAYPIPV